jgi:hypothetical protein
MPVAITTGRTTHQKFAIKKDLTPCPEISWKKVESWIFSGYAIELREGGHRAASFLSPYSLSSSCSR